MKRIRIFYLGCAYYMNRLKFREINFTQMRFFGIKIDSVKDGESDDIKNLSRFPGNPVLGIMI